MVVPTRQYSSRDLPGQLTMKERPAVEIGDKKVYESKLKDEEEKYFAIKNKLNRPLNTDNNDG